MGKATAEGGSGSSGVRDAGRQSPIPVAGLVAWVWRAVSGQPRGRMGAPPVNAESGLRAAPRLGQSLVRQVIGELRWAFTPPWTWLTGVAVNLVLSLLWLLVTPLTGRPDWAILIGVYFAVFILADVTTTNVLGAGALRVRLSLLRGLRVRRILFLKNLALFLVVGVPTLILTAVITVHSEADYRLLVTVPRVMYPTLTWLGVGDLVSVVLPVAIIPLRQRWQQRRQVWRTARWLIHLVLPYALLYAVDPLSKLPTIAIVGLHLRGGSALVRAVVVCGLGASMWALGFTAALILVRRRGIRIR